MKMIAFTVAFLASAAAVAQAPGSSPSNQGNSPDPDQTICRTVSETGSRLSRRRVCKTRAEWETQRREARDSAQRSQNKGPGQDH